MKSTILYSLLIAHCVTLGHACTCADVHPHLQTVAECDFAFIGEVEEYGRMLSSDDKMPVFMTVRVLERISGGFRTNRVSILTGLGSDCRTVISEERFPLGARFSFALSENNVETLDGQKFYCLSVCGTTWAICAGDVLAGEIYGKEDQVVPINQFRQMLTNALNEASSPKSD